MISFNFYLVSLYLSNKSFLWRRKANMLANTFFSFKVGKNCRQLRSGIQHIFLQVWGNFFDFSKLWVLERALLIRLCLKISNSCGNPFIEDLLKNQVISEFRAFSYLFVYYTSKRVCFSSLISGVWIGKKKKLKYITEKPLDWKKMLQCGFIVLQKGWNVIFFSKQNRKLNERALICIFYQSH